MTEKAFQHNRSESVTPLPSTTTPDAPHLRLVPPPDGGQPDPALRILGTLAYLPGEGGGYRLVGPGGDLVASGRHLVDLIQGLHRVRPYLPGVGRRASMFVMKSKVLRGADAYRDEGESLSQFIAVACRREIDRRREQEIAEMERLENEAIEEARQGAIEALEMEQVIAAGWKALATVQEVGHA